MSSVRVGPVDRATLLEYELNGDGQITLSPRGKETMTEWITADEGINLGDAR